MLRILTLVALSSLIACGDDDDSCADCDDLGVVEDAGTPDAATDAGSDASIPDGGVPDGGALDVAATWSFPAVVEGRLPGYLTHLMGTEVDHELDFRSSCAALVNMGIATEVEVEAQLGDDAAGAATSATLDEDEAEDVCAEPTYDRESIDALAAPLATTLAGRLSAGGDVLSTDETSVSLTPGTSAWWTHPTLTREEQLELFAVFVRPADAAVIALVDDAAAVSASPADFRTGYTRPDRVRSWTLAPGEDGRDVPPVVMLGDETLDWTLDITGGGVVDVLLFTSGDFEVWAGGGSVTPTQSWTGQVSGDTGSFTNTAPGAAYVLVVVSPDDASGDRMVSLSRNWTEVEIVDDALSSLWFALFGEFGLPQAESLAADYFAMDRTVRSPAALLAADTIDGAEAATLLAAALEAIQLHATLTVADGLMMAGVLSSPGSDLVLPLDLTDDRFGNYLDARNASRTTRSTAMGDAGFAEVVIPELRARGITPAP